jgi:transposase
MITAPPGVRVLVWSTPVDEAGRFKWPPMTDGVVRLSALQLSVLLSGLPWERLQAPPIFRPRAAC